MMRKLCLLALMAVTSAMGCSTGSERPFEDQRVEIPPAPDNGIQIVLPEMEFEPFEDRMVCFDIKPFTEDVWVRAYRSFQGSMGHHVALFNRNDSDQARHRVLNQRVRADDG